ncbi:MAG: hypothetical protein Ta2G_21110 [Termitinemataceae bacterium]|nr:MAG: hypothetical protein Ta2G_21110 [Termitinemataceae bacterium]
MRNVVENAFVKENDTHKKKPQVEGTQEACEIIPEDEWLAAADEFIEKYRPALEALAK